MTATDPKATFAIWRKILIFIIAGNIGLLAAMWLLSLLVSDICLDRGGRIGRTWAECEFQAGEIAAWSDYVGITPVVISIAVWIGLWALSHRVISNVANRGK